MAPNSIVVTVAEVPQSHKEDALAEEASSALVRGLIEHAQETARRESLGEFYKANHSKAVVFAYSSLKDRAEAEDAVAKTYMELLTGRAKQESFFRALKCNILDRQRRLGRERSMFEPTERAFDPRHLPGEDRMAGGESEEFSVEPASSQPEDQDPLEILIQREEAAARLAMVERAMSDPRWRYVKGRKWARPLVGDVRK